ncbi:MAG: peptide chain release factor 2 [Alphaproteobacteria bacterium]
MKAEIENIVNKINASLDLLKKSLKWDTSIARQNELNEISNKPDFWDDPSKAQKIMQEKSELDRKISAYTDLRTSLDDSIELLEMAENENDNELIKEAEDSIIKMETKSAEVEMEALFCGEVDGNNCFLEINAGAGGTESCDWANMVLRMYSRWANSHGFKAEVIDQVNGEEAGIKSTTIHIKGINAYGWAKTESGVHRLVRISPFDSSARRHTSFCSVIVYPEIDDDIVIEVEEKDLKVDTYRASGAGGQHVNTTDSAVRITHIPTKTVVQCQNQRSQHRNREEAMKMLKAKLYEIEMQKKEAEAEAEHAQKTDIGWGHQIRSYVLHPYQMIKDLRTNVETSATQDVLDGKLDEFMQASLASRVGS